MPDPLTTLLPDVMSEALAALAKYRQGKQPRTKQSVEHAKKILADENATGTAVFLATQLLLGGNEFLAWEPESIWLELSDKGVDPPLENRDKLMAVITIMYGDAFHWDALAFENTMVALNDIPSAPDAIQEASPGEMAWGAFEAEFLAQHAGHNDDYDYEPARYAAASLNRGGFILAPELLVFAQDDLDNFNRGFAELKGAVIERWDNTDKTKLEELDLTEDPVDVQLGRLAAVTLYVSDRAQQLRRELNGL